MGYIVHDFISNKWETSPYFKNQGLPVCRVLEIPPRRKTWSTGCDGPPKKITVRTLLLSSANTTTKIIKIYGVRISNFIQSITSFQITTTFLLMIQTKRTIKNRPTVCILFIFMCKSPILSIWGSM